MVEQVKGCRHCWRPSDIGGHNDGCPVSVGTDTALAEWQAGYDHGAQDEHLPYWRLGWSKTYQLGYRAGQRWVDELVDEAAQHRDLE